MTDKKKIDFWKKPTQSSLRPYQRQNVTCPISFVQPTLPTQKDDSKDSEPSSDEEAEEVLDPGAVEDEAEVHTGFRASFPLSFGKQESKVISLENVHLKTQRPTAGGTKSAAVRKELLVNRIGTKGLGESALPKKVEVEVDNGRSRLPPNCHNEEELTVGPPMPSRANGKQDSEDDESPIFGPPMPSRDHGKQNDDNIEAPMVGPPMPSRALMEGSSSDDDDENDTADDNSGDEFRVPLSNEIVLKGHTKVVSALAVDPTGSRVLTGGYDYTVKMYDFQGMNAQLRSFRQLEPSEGHQVRSLSWSPTADMFIAVTGSAQAKIFDRDGFTLGEFLKGDMYIRDLKNTKGHISGLTAGQWHPKDREKALTSSEDGSLRIWDVTDFKSQKQVIKPRLARPGRVSVSTCCWGQDGKCLAGGLADGSVQVWNVKAGWGSRPDIYIEKAHEGGDDVTGLCISADGYTLLSRSTDCTMKIWDLRQTKRAVQVFDGLPNSYAQTNVSFSPDERLILTGTSVERGGLTGGLLILFCKSKLELVRKVGLSATQSVVCTYWHPRLNQVHYFWSPAVVLRRILRSSSVVELEVLWLFL